MHEVDVGDTRRSTAADPRSQLDTPATELIARELVRDVNVAVVVIAVQPTPAASIQRLIVAGTGSEPIRDSIAPDGSTFLARVLASDEALLERHHPGDRSIAGDMSAIVATAGAPVRVPSGPRGALCVGLHAPAPAPADAELTLWLVESYARMTALCMRDAALLGGLLAAARHDSLTGCLNVGALGSELARETQRAERQRTPLSALFVDLDDFKEFNTRYGHPIGSRALADAAAAMRAATRACDIVARYGGDEFVLLLPGSDETGAAAAAQRLRERIAELEVNGIRGTLAASIGVAQWRPTDDPEELLVLAQSAQRGAKRGADGLVLASRLDDRD